MPTYGIQANGTYLRKPLDVIIDDLEVEAQVQYGADVDLSPGSPLKRFINTVALELNDQEQRIEASYNAGFLDTATGEDLENVVSTYYGLERKAAVKATGTLRFSRTTGAPVGGVTVPSGTKAETTDGVQFETTAAGTIAQGGTSVDIAARAVLAGSKGNATGGTVTVLTQPVSGVEAVTNPSAFAGGADQETEAALRERARQSGAGVGKGTRDAIRADVLAVANVNQCTVQENTGQDGGQENKVFDDDGTGTASETVNSAGGAGVATKIARKMTLTAALRRFVQHWNQRINVVSGTPTFKVRLEKDTSGSPNGALVDSVFEKTNYQPTGGSVVPGKWDKGEYVDQAVTATVWLVWEATAGAATFDGGTGGTAGDVKVYKDGAWANAATITKLNTELIGGIPPGGIRCLVSGGTDAAVAQAIHDAKAAGIETDGLASATAVDDGNENVTIRFERPTEKTVYVTVAATGGVAADIENAVIKYVGGTDLNGTSQPGLGVGDDVFFAKVVAAVMGVAGVKNATVTLGFSASPTGTADLAIGVIELARATTTSVVVTVS